MNQVNFDIVFVCGSLKPGADGIGDYCRRMGAQLMRNGHKVKLLAYNDRHIDTTTIDLQSSDELVLDTLRLPTNLNANQKATEINRWLDGHAPQIVSLQYVLYAFNNRGLPFSFASDIKQVFPQSKFHLMFHELWLAMEKNPPFKDKIFGFFQKYIIRSMIRVLKPVLIHTQSRTYLNLLKLNGIAAGHLPIISNIPVVDESHISRIEPNNSLQFIIFGFICNAAPVNDFARELSDYARSSNKEISIVFAGKNGSNLAEWEQAFKQNNLPYSIKGLLTVEEISHLMSESHIGISTTPFSLYEKSGSVAAMFKHGLPIINVAESILWQSENITNYIIDEPIVEYKPGIIAQWVNHLNKPNLKRNLADVVSKFTNDLELHLSKNS
ncbi:MAG: hypothetical protein IT245_01120 [Bacteroidia bacterium]|nr:hypothetical protein [Bacteroidia bacterium]